MTATKHDVSPLPPAPFVPTPRFRKFSVRASRFLPQPRDVYVYLPPGYSEHRRRRFPVLYFNDGQNLFDGARAFVPGQAWKLGDSAQRLILSGAMRPVIIVGIDHGRERRLDEFTPTRDERRKAGGLADLYLRMLVEEIKPLVDARFRTIPDGEVTGLGGSSLGGLVTMYAGVRHPGVFGRLAVMSPSVWWDRRAIVATVDAIVHRNPQRIWLDVGTAEGAGTVRDARMLKNALVRKGWRAGTDLSYHEVPGAEHSEAAWAARVPHVLEYLYPPE